MLPLHAKRVVIADHVPLIDKIKALIQRWVAKKLSYAGRLQLTKAVICGVFSFWNQVYVFPARVVGKIESLCKTIIWNDSGLVVTHPFKDKGSVVKEVLALNKAIVFMLVGDISSKI